MDKRKRDEIDWLKVSRVLLGLAIVYVVFPVVLTFWVMDFVKDSVPENMRVWELYATVAFSVTSLLIFIRIVVKTMRDIKFFERIGPAIQESFLNWAREVSNE